jgi:hypothetical protein
MKIIKLISALLIISVTCYGFDFIYEPNHLTRNPDPFFIKNRTMRFDDHNVELDKDNSLYYREYNNKRYYCTDGTVFETDDEINSRLEREEQVKMEKIEQISQQAAIFRWVLQQHFGPGAETNRNVTETSVAQYFINRRITGTSEPTDASDALLLQTGFEAIKNCTGDGTSWSLPWELIPNLPN